MQLLIAYAMSFLGTPYKWGGSSPMEGMDCSGFVQEILMAAGVNPSGDNTAQGLYNHFEKNGSYNRWGPGSLAFFGQNAMQVTHVAFCVDSNFCIEAGGGGAKVVDLQSAIAHQAFVRLRQISYRKDLVAVIRPNYLAPFGP